MLNKLKLRLVLLALLVLGNYLIWAAATQAGQSDLRIDFLNVGQGDAILIRTPDHHDILVDGGPDDQVLTELGKILPLWDRDLDLVVATHLEADHITGLISVLERYQVAEVLTPQFSSTTKTGQMWQEQLSKVPKINYADASDDYQWGEVGWDTLLPLPGSDAQTVSSNINSTIAKISYGDTTILLTDDMPAETEKVLLSIYPGLAANILKVSHHGSKYSSGAQWLQAISPTIAVISVGKNSYGHPNPETISRLQAVAADIYRTDQDGTIEVIFGDNGYAIKTNVQKKFYQN